MANLQLISKLQAATLINNFTKLLIPLKNYPKCLGQLTVTCYL